MDACSSTRGAYHRSRKYRRVIFRRQNRHDGPRGAGGCGLKAGITIINLLFSLVCAAGAQSPAMVDTLQTRWGPIPPPYVDNQLRPEAAPTPTWKHVVRLPYVVLSVPVNGLDWTVRRGLVEAERLGLFTQAETLVKGLRGPFDVFWLPTGSLGEQRGLELGLTGQRPHFLFHDAVLKVTGTYSTKRSSSVTVGLRTDYGRPSWVEVGGGRVRDGKRRFYGVGWDTDEEQESVYRRHLDWLGLAWRWDRDDGFEMTIGSHYTAVKARHGRDDTDDALDVVFAAELPAGYGITSSGLTQSVKLGYDSSKRSGNPVQGTRFVVAYEYFRDTDHSDVAHATWVAALERFFSLGLPQRTLAIKGWWLQQQALGDDPIPFTRLLNNRDPYKLRGYGSQRFHAQGFTGLTVEYRWPFWMLNRPGGAGLDAYVFGDAGQPFTDERELALSRLLYSGGVGLRAIGTDGGFSLRAEVALGQEGVHLRLSAKQLFQFIEAGFYDGSEPLPLLR